MFNQFLTDTLTLHKSDGQVFENVRASVSTKGILITDIHLPIQAGDKLMRLLPSGLTEVFVVDDPGFCQKFHGIPAHFQVRIRRAGAGRAPAQIQNVFHGPVGNVAQDSANFSQTATLGVQKEDLSSLIEGLSNHLDELNLEPRQKQRAAAQISVLKAELAGEPDPTIVAQTGRTLRNIIEGAVGSLVASAVQPGLWHWVQQTLTKL